jgi:protein N-terminal methyltransferase
MKGLQEFVFGEKYDCIWVQWCLCYLTDDDCLTFLERARDSLVECPDSSHKSGLMFIKENIADEKF